MNNISIIILVGGKNTRLKNVNSNKSIMPKSLQKINSKYLIFYVIENYLVNNFRNFILSIGNYKIEFYKFFKNLKKINNKKVNIFFNQNKYLNSVKKNDHEINILLFNTGIKANKAERVLKIAKKIKLKEFGVTYGDGVGNININKLYENHLNDSVIASSAAIKAKSQYGHFIYKNSAHSRKIKNEIVIDFIEKPLLNLWVNIGYFFFKKEALLYFNKYYKNDLEMGVIKKIANKKKLMVYKHNKFWKSVDTLKDVHELSALLKNDKK
jgi:glucose-1-phosphate cytidylyltransferase